MRLLYTFSFICLALLLCHAPSNANHMVGGEFSYKCIGNNQFEILLTLWLDCKEGNEAVINSDDSSTYNIFEKVTNDRVVGGKWIVPESTEIIPMAQDAALECFIDLPSLCLMKKTFRFIDTLPPSQHGYYLAYQRYARTSTIINIDRPGNTGASYIGEIPPFQGNNCPNNSAIFKNNPPQIICKDYNFVYDFSATDPDGDSLSYELCEAFKSEEGVGKPFFFGPPPYAPVVYLPPYSAEFPMDGAPGITIVPTTGMMYFSPNKEGRYVVKVCATEWRNGVSLGSVSRDVVFTVNPCQKNVAANMPFLADDPASYIVECKSKTVFFQNTSIGGQTYHWDFGVNGATSTEFQPSFTYPDTGVYLVKLRVNPGSNCSDSVARLVKIYPEFIPDFSYEGKLCPGEPVQFTDQTVATFPPVVAWDWNFDDGSTSSEQNPLHSFPAGGFYQTRLIAKSSKGCVDTAIKMVEIPNFSPSAGADTIIVEGFPYSFNATGGNSFEWYPADYLSDPTIPNPSANFPGPGSYTYQVTIKSDSCVYTDTIKVMVVKEANIFVPNAFSPNGDGVNDLLKIERIGFGKINFFKIFDRWGNLVFESYDANPWDGYIRGRQADVGTYIWVVSVQDHLNNTVSRKGTILLIR